MIASALSASRAASAARTLGTIPPAMTPSAMRASASVDGQGVELAAVGVAHAVHVGHQDQLPGAEAAGEARGGVVGVDVADDALLVAGERRNHRHLAADEDRVDEVAAKADDVGDEAQARDALGDEQAAVHARQAHGVARRGRAARHQLAVDDAAKDGGGDLERGLVGDAEAAFELALDAEPVEPLGDPLAAAVHEHDRAAFGRPRRPPRGPGAAPRASCRRA